MSELPFLEHVQVGDYIFGRGSTELTHCHVFEAIYNDEPVSVELFAKDHIIKRNPPKESFYKFKHRMHIAQNEFDPVELKIYNHLQIIDKLDEFHFFPKYLGYCNYDGYFRLVFDNHRNLHQLNTFLSKHGNDFPFHCKYYIIYQLMNIVKIFHNYNVYLYRNTPLDFTVDDDCNLYVAQPYGLALDLKSAFFHNLEFKIESVYDDPKTLEKTQINRRYTDYFEVGLFIISLMLLGTNQKLKDLDIFANPFPLDLDCLMNEDLSQFTRQLLSKNPLNREFTGVPIISPYEYDFPIPNSKILNEIDIFNQQFTLTHNQLNQMAISKENQQSILNLNQKITHLENDIINETDISKTPIGTFLDILSQSRH
eukprot:NODE_220_length_12432_cov_0.484878.p3 type:complete len:368 gc:universal NODE_220_length_12432_cov_0.484878:9138-8035(-)